MLTLIKGADVFAPSPLGTQDVLIAGGKIVDIQPEITIDTYQRITTVDGTHCILAPGFVDSLVHITGGGGEAGFASRTPEMTLTEATLHGTTTVIAALGTDSSSRTHSNLIAKAKELKEYMTQKFTDVDENYIKRVLRSYDFGHIPKNTSKSLKKKMETEADPHKILAILKKNIPETFLTETKQSNPLIKDGREVILSEYLVTDK